MKVVKHTRRYVVQFRSWDSDWIEDRSFRTLEKSRRYISKQQKYQPWEYRIVDTETR